MTAHPIPLRSCACFIRRRGGMALAILLVMGWCMAAAAQTLPVAGDGENLWIALNADDSIQVYQRNEFDAANRVLKAPSFSGRLAPEGIAVGNDCLWLVSDKLTVQSMPLNLHPQPGKLPLELPRMEQQLPRHEALVAFGAVQSGPWALVRVEDQASLDRIDSGMTEAEVATQAASQPAASQPTTQRTSPGVVRADRLLRLEQNRWNKVELPNDWPARGKAWIVAESSQDEKPLLLTAPAGEDSELWLYRPTQTDWQKSVFTLEGSRDIIPLGVDHQLVLARPVEDKSAGVTLELLIVRPEGIRRFGTISMVVPKDAVWGVTTAGQTIALISAQGKKLLWTRKNLMNEEVAPASPLEEDNQVLLFGKGVPMQLMMMGLAMVLVAALVWRRGGDGGKITLPDGYESADLVRRFIAAMIDMAIPVAIVAYYQQIAPIDLVSSWYYALPSLETLQSNLAVIGLLLLHTTISEMFTARTLGKMMLGLRVVSVDGKPPNIWQVLCRNLLKSCDLLAWPLLVLPLVRPHGQRLGDILARTLVVTPISPDREDQDGG
ncbi:MAG: RDD family protein [Phycisphaeraceae bacterium]|nr:RDD family protein [Phycisphaeraceae bacterium]